MDAITSKMSKLYRLQKVNTVFSVFNIMLLVAIAVCGYIPFRYTILESQLSLYRETDAEYKASRCSEKSKLEYKWREEHAPFFVEALRPYFGIERIPLKYIAAANKPVIYLYPEEKTNVNVKVNFDGELTTLYPDYTQDGWNVVANQDGTLQMNNKEYKYLYWEGATNKSIELNSGFCVKGTDTVKFLEKVLKEQGLNSNETNDFIAYWAPLMSDNKYNVISFITDEYKEMAELDINPKPDTEIRVFMVWYGSDIPVDIESQSFDTPNRTGFTVVEWGGSQLNNIQ